MTLFKLENAKAPRCKNSFVLSTEVVNDAQSKENCRRIVANLLGISESKQFLALCYLVDNLEGNLFLGSQRDFSEKANLSRKPITQMLATLSDFGLADVNTGYIRVSDDLIRLFNQFDHDNGHVQLTIDIKTVPNQTTLDI